MGTEGVILAAGKSSRMMGNSKMTMDLNGRTVIERSIDSLRPFCSRISRRDGVPCRSGDGFGRTLPGKSSSFTMQTAKKACSPPCGWACGIQKGSVSSSCPATALSLPMKSAKSCWRCKGDIVLPAYQGKRGHPVLLSRRAIEGLLADDRCQSLQEYISSNKAEIIAVDRPEILWDIDTPEDYAKAVDYFQAKEAR